MFIALKGERFDGHDFIADAFEAGATGVMAAREVPPHDPWPEPEKAPVWLEVDDTQRALEDLARALRDFMAARVVAVTGSVGKTTVKDMIAAALEGVAGSRDAVRKTPGNLNNHIGLPLTLAGATGREKYLVLELGMSAPGEIARLTHMARPDVGLVTRATAAHLAFFPSVEGIADAKAELWAHLPAAGIAVVNADDARLLARAARPRAGGSSATITYGAAPAATIRLVHAAQSEAGVAVELATPEGPLAFTLNTVGVHNAHNAAGALAAVHALGLALAPAAAALAQGFRPAKHRLERLTIGGVKVLDDCYNANPASMRAALEAFESCVGAGVHSIAVLGSMRELGPEADAMHIEIGMDAARRGVDTLFATGPHADALVHGARAGGITAVTAAADVKDLVDAIVSTATPGTWLLLKGSRGERLERVLEALTAAHGGEVG
ncbi:MAG: UDP-N-acetylmuramoyl-tripeptide--D-alanyl-D-alanine ligase [Myxococcota bacterium]